MNEYRWERIAKEAGSPNCNFEVSANLLEDKTTGPEHTRKPLHSRSLQHFGSVTGTVKFFPKSRP